MSDIVDLMRSMAASRRAAMGEDVPKHGATARWWRAQQMVCDSGKYYSRKQKACVPIKRAAKYPARQSKLCPEGYYWDGVDCVSLDPFTEERLRTPYRHMTTVQLRRQLAECNGVSMAMVQRTFKTREELLKAVSAPNRCARVLAQQKVQESVARFAERRRSERDFRRAVNTRADVHFQDFL